MLRKIGYLFGVVVTAFLVAACLPTATPPPTNAPAAKAAVAPTEFPADASGAAGTPTPRIQAYQGLSFKQYAAPPLMTIDPSASYTATIRTNKGLIVLELFPDSAPKTVNNFVFLAEEGFYNGLLFHRVIEQFMIQGGDPTGTGGSGPGYKFEDEIDSRRVFSEPGILAMANSGPNTNGSQFFITTVPTPHLNGAHTIFGKILNGQEVADAISKVPKDQNGRPIEPITIETIQIAKTG